MAAYTKYNAAQSAARARSFTTWKVGYCLNFTWHCIDYPNSAGLASANAAWNDSSMRVTNGSTPPAGAPVYWGGGQYGHIAISLGGGNCRSTDYPSKGRIGTVSIKSLTRLWRLTYRGWSRDYGDKPILGLQVASAYPAAMSVDLKAPITRTNLAYGKTNADVARYEKALWNFLGGVYRASILKDKAAVGDQYYGNLTQNMTIAAYRKCGWAQANQPGPQLMAKLGFTSVR